MFPRCGPGKTFIFENSKIVAEQNQLFYYSFSFFQKV